MPPPAAQDHSVPPYRASENSLDALMYNPKQMLRCLWTGFKKAAPGRAQALLAK